MSFAGLFARQTKEYLLHRPTYPPELFKAIDSFVSSTSAAFEAKPKHLKALDLACGSGQATLALAEQYSEVVGMDSSPEQLAEAPQHPRVSYLLGSANDIPRSSVEDSSIDLVTVAQAFHWFDFPRAFAEITRVLRKPQKEGFGPGVCAIWGYGNPVLQDSQANKRVNVDFYDKTLGEYWSDRRRYVDNEYREIEAEMRKVFERVEVDRTGLRIEKEATIGDFVKYVSSWSAYQTWKEKNPGQEDPLKALEKELCKDFGVQSADSKISFHYPIFLALGANPKKV